MLQRVLTAVLLALALAAPAVAADVAALSDKVQKRYKSLNSFSAEFTQVLVNAASKERETRTGRLVFAQPSLIRWETVRPEKELLVVGRDAAWNVFPEEKAAYRYQVEDILGSKTMLRFLSGKGNLREDFHVKEEPGAPEGQALLKLIPREAEPGLVLAHAWVDLKTDMLARIMIEDFYGNVNEVSLADVRLNPSVSRDQFVYSPPGDFTIYDNSGMQSVPRK